MARTGIAPFVGAIGEAWDELRVHKLRVLLSLIGVALAVAALTAVVAIGELQRQFMAEMNDRWGGREATLTIAKYPNGSEQVDQDAWNARSSGCSNATTSRTPPAARRPSCWRDCQRA